MAGAREIARRIAQSQWMLLWLGILSFLENTVLLVAIEPLFIPVMAANRKRVFLMAGALVCGCLLGALATYWAASALYEPVIEPALRSLGWANDFQRVRGDVEQGGFWAMFLIGLTPVPFQLGTVASGLIGLNLFVFMAAVVLSRSLRYVALALLVLWVGRRAEKLIEKYQLEMFVGFLILFVVIAAGSLLA